MLIPAPSCSYTYLVFFFLMLRPPPRPTLFPYTTLFRSARSTDDGKTFARETLATDKPTGACGCCGMKAFVDREGNVFALYRAASEKVNRDETLLISRNRGVEFEIALAHAWKIASCPMSSAFCAEST